MMCINTPAAPQMPLTEKSWNAQKTIHTAEAKEEVKVGPGNNMDSGFTTVTVRLSCCIALMAEGQSWMQERLISSTRASWVNSTKSFSQLIYRMGDTVKLNCSS